MILQAGVHKTAGLRKKKKKVHANVHETAERKAAITVGECIDEIGRKQ